MYAGCPRDTMSDVPAVLRPRWFLALLTGALGGLAFGGHGLVSHDWLALAFGVSYGCICASIVRRRRITVTDDGLWIKRSYVNQMFSSWAEVVGVERRRFGPFATDQLRLREAVRKYVEDDVKGQAKVVWKPRPNQRVLIGLYDKRWRTGPIGAALIARGVSLEATAPPESANRLGE
jgi:hypothetical protein